MALTEDAPFGDLTTQAFVPAGAGAVASLIARQAGVLSGAEVFSRAMRALDSGVVVTLHCADGERFEAGQSLAQVSGPARAVLTCERVALNLIQRMSGIATVTARYVEAVEGAQSAAGRPVRVVDTRKTTPGLRALERYAVRCGGGHNHRFSLSDAVMAKDNHLAALESGGIGLAEAIRQARQRLPHTTHIEVEVDRLDQVPAALEGGADTIMLDNFSLEDIRRGVELIGGRALVEASGNVRLETVAEIAATGVDVISVGALTHSVRSLDLGLDMDVRAEASHGGGGAN
ncbi:carboxylating nicotinate-nucleotide diphosphorylase [Nesterenkonia flava]|uniref:nicotinate-nucleotide diphosphorylase (carboxylating) n=1 Tax=Nesterenkonia flava TaxID=469799 RepID=A0ABU1FTU4_9MICC|nr:carboxylating nicotinate-nucleotide diphosphorylase [Nesterenkonia flava]MDR5712064.1 carboxylating nicotinate-nucleotide diphosphorylase [Nesterenkonia flava]